MAYDKETIKRARDTGALESDLDALALGLSKKEKHDLSRRIQSTQPGSDSAGRGENVFERARRKAPSASQKKGSGLWEKVLDFFRTLFSGVSRENIAKRKALKESEKQLLSFSVPVYDQRFNLVKKEFIGVIAMLEKKVEQFASFFDANFSVGSEELFEEKTPCFARFVIENSLSMDQLMLLRQLMEMDLPRSFRVKGEATTQKDMNLLIKKFVDSFDSVNVSRIEDQLDFYISIINLKNYNFDSLFSLFQADTSSPTTRGFKDFALEHSLGYLKNLDCYLAGVNFSKLREEHYQWFDRFQQEKMSGAAGGAGGEGLPMGSGPGHAPGEQYTREHFKSMIGPLRKLKEKQIVSHLVRMGEENPTYRPKPVINTISYVEKYRTLIEACMREHVEKSIRSLREQQVGEQVAELFEGYKQFEYPFLLNRENNENLRHAGMRGYESGFVFSLIYNYLKKIYIERYKKSVNAVVVEGEFRKKEMGSDFSNTYYNLDEVYETVQELAAELSSESALAIKMRHLMEGQMENPIARKKFENEIYDLDQEMIEISRSAGILLMKMLKYMETILADFKGLRVVDLINAKTIGGVANRNLLFTYDKFVQSLKQLEVVLEKFIVVKESL